MMTKKITKSINPLHCLAASQAVFFYSSFEVMPNKETIKAGTKDDVTGLIYNYDISPCTVHKMSIKSFQTPENCDVIVDWGDGHTSSIKKHEYASFSNGSFELAHDYLTSMTSNMQKFTVKIYGKNLLIHEIER